MPSAGFTISNHHLFYLVYSPSRITDYNALPFLSNIEIEMHHCNPRMLLPSFTFFFYIKCFDNLFFTLAKIITFSQKCPEMF